MRIATVQMKSQSKDVSGNLFKAESLIRKAKSEGAELVLLPEFFGCGYSYDLATRESAETLPGRSGAFLKELASELGIWLAGCVYESNEEKCFDTFLLVGPSNEFFSHRKWVPTAFETFFFESGEDPFVVETPIGRIALIVCAESLYSRFLNDVVRAKPDLILIAYAAPGASSELSKLLGGPPSDYIRRLALRWVQESATPVVTACLSGDWQTTLPYLSFIKISLPFFAQSGIYQFGQKKYIEVAELEGVAVADVNLGVGESRESIEQNNSKEFVEPLPRAIVSVFRAAEKLGRFSYKNWQRRKSR